MPMNRQRWLPPDDFSSEELLSLPAPVRLTAAGLRLYADAAGRERVNARLIHAQLYPLDDAISPADIEDHLLLLADAGFLVLYRSPEGRDLFQIVRWPSTSHEPRSTFPEPDPTTFEKSVGRPPEDFTAVEREGESEESEGEERGGARRARGRARGAGGEGETASNDLPETDDLPPSPFCSTHPKGTSKACRGCGTARLRLEDWQRRHTVRFNPADDFDDGTDTTEEP